MSPKYHGWSATGKTVDVSRGELGELVDADVSQMECVARLKNMRDEPTVHIKKADLDLSSAQWGQDWKFQYELSVPEALRPIAKSYKQGQPTLGKLAHHILGFLSGVQDNESRIPGFPRFAPFLGSVDARQQTADAMSKNTHPNVRAVLERQSFTLQDVLDNGQLIGSHEHTNGHRNGICHKTGYCGIYLIVYWGFPPGSKYKGPIPYVGQSNDVCERGHQHRVNPWREYSGEYRSEHYQCAREATKWKMVLLLKHSPNEAGSQENAETLRDIYENTFFVLLRSYHSRAWDVAAAERIGQDKPIEQAVARSLRHLQIGHLYSEIAKTSFAATGYSDLAGPKAGGPLYGLNVSSPMCGAVSRNEKTPICVQELSGADRKVFHLPYKTAPPSETPGRNYVPIIYKTYRYKGKDYNIRIYWNGDPAILTTGDDMYVSWEVMNGDVAHPVPAFPMGNIGCYSNWKAVLRVGLKVTFKKPNSSRWRAMYVQYGDGMKAQIDDNVPGATRVYGVGAAVLAHLLNGHWPNKQNWVPNLGLPNMVRVLVDPFERKIFCRPVTGPLERLNEVKYSLLVPTQELRGLRAKDNQGNTLPENFQNVDGEWQKKDMSWINVNKLSTTYGRRTWCDRDYFGHYVSHICSSLF